jgi:hypothetical protein
MNLLSTVIASEARQSKKVLSETGLPHFVRNDDRSREIHYAQ